MNILITGTSSGIGYGLAVAYLKQNNKVWGISRRLPDFTKKFESYFHLQADLSDKEKLRTKLPQFLPKPLTFDLVILNSGVLGKIKLMDEVSVEEMKKVMDINVWANKVLLDELFNSGANIKQVVGMSSKASLRSSQGWGSYSLSKAGLNMLMNIYAKEYPETHFISFAPGLVDSEIQDYICAQEDDEKYPTTKIMKEARHTELMPNPLNAAPRLIAGIRNALDHESGGFVDVREM